MLNLFKKNKFAYSLEKYLNFKRRKEVKNHNHIGFMKFQCNDIIIEIKDCIHY